MIMTKFIILAVAIIGINFSGFCWTKIEKKDGGFFGYKLVTETHVGGNNALACNGPGKLKCVFKYGYSVEDEGGIILRFDDYTPIEKDCLSRITRENTSGSFYYSTNLFVKYSYDIDTDNLTMEIYSIYEAKKFGFI